MSSGNHSEFSFFCKFSKFFLSFNFFLLFHFLKLCFCNVWHISIIQKYCHKYHFPITTFFCVFYFRSFSDNISKNLLFFPVISWCFCSQLPQKHCNIFTQKKNQKYFWFFLSKHLERFRKIRKWMAKMRGKKKNNFLIPKKFQFVRWISKYGFENLKMNLENNLIS